MDCRSEGSLTVDNFAGSKVIRSRCRGRLITFDMLPDDVLLEIFVFILDKNICGFSKLWIKLAHVCRRWRSLVFQSPHRLNLRLICTPSTRVRDTLDIWPPLRLIITDFFGRTARADNDNIIAALEHNDRVSEIGLSNLTRSQLGYVTDSAAMKRPFPELTDLLLSARYEDYGSEPILPDSFLVGTAPRLRSLYLNYVPFPGLLKLLLSTTHLIHLGLHNIPPSGYIPPEAMATSLSALTNLEAFSLDFRHPRPRSALGTRRQTPPPLTRSILPSVTKIRFYGASEYLEEILACIDAPRLNVLHITFVQTIIRTPQLLRLISGSPTLRAPEKGCITFGRWAMIVKFRSQISDYEVLGVEIPYTAPERQPSSLAQVCTSSLPPVSTLEDLYFFEFILHPLRLRDVENMLWLDLLRPFVVVKNLYLSEQFMPHIAPALQELVGGRTTEVLPTLENIFLQGFQPSEPLREDIGKFVAARRLTSHPVTVSRWDKDSKQDRFQVDYW